MKHRCGRITIIAILILSAIAEAERASERNSDGVVNGNCVNGGACYTPNSYCNILIKKCKCIKNYHVSSNGTACLQVVSLWDRCEDDCQCPRHATCKKHRCICDSNHPTSSNGHTCRDDSHLNQSCGDDTICVDTNTECTNGTCICRVGYHISVNSSKCLKDAHILESCDSDENCVDPYTHCFRGACFCSPGSTSGFSPIRCLGNVHLQQTCNNSTYCVDPHTKCRNGTCSCKFGYHISKSYPVCLKNPAGTVNGDCNKNIFCSAPYSYCDNETHTCKCLSDSYTSSDGTECLIGVSLGDCCKEDIQCSKYATCHRHRCTCDSDHMVGLDGKTCKVGLHGKCDSVDDCWNQNTTECGGNVTKECRCKDFYQEEEEKCQAPVGGPCSTLEGCIDPNAECMMNAMGQFKCHCRDGFEDNGRDCRKKHHGIHIHVHEVIEKKYDIDIEF